MKLDPVYTELLKERLEYFKDKKITELKDEEIYEYINLKKEFREIFREVSETVKDIWINVYGEAFERYTERVLNK